MPRKLSDRHFERVGTYQDADYETCIDTGKSEIRFRSHFPDTNPVDALHDVVKTLSYIGVFDDLKKDVASTEESGELSFEDAVEAVENSVRLQHREA